MRTPRPVHSAAATAVAVLALLAGCGGSSDDVAAAGADPHGGASAPATCFDAFPEAMGTPDLANLTLVPEDWPAPPHHATLCQAFQQPDGRSDLVGYLAADGDATDAVDGYESTLASLGVERSGDVLTGTSGDTSFTITPLSDYAFTLEFRR